MATKTTPTTTRPTTMLERFGRFVLRHRLVVALAWVALLVAGGVASGPANNRLTVDFSLPGQPGDTADKQLVADYGASSFDTYIPVVTVPSGSSVEADSAKVQAVFDAIKTAVPTLRVVDPITAGDDRLVTKDGRTAFGFVEGPSPTKFTSSGGVDQQILPAMRKAAEEQGVSVQLTSFGLISAGGDSGGSGVLFETLLGALGALAVLAFVFASFLAFVPLMIAMFSILTTFLLVLGLSYLTDMSFIVEFLIALVGLGVAIDYSLLVVSRWREERDRGATNDEAIVISMSTAGHAVLASGVTVAISLLSLLVVPVPFLRSMGLGGMLIPLVSVSSVLTLLPVLLSRFGPAIDRPRIRHEETASKAWTAWAGAIVRRRFFAAAAALVVLAVLIAPVFGIKIGNADSSSLAKSGPAYKALTTLTDGGIGNGILTPMDVLVPTSQVDKAIAAARDLDGIYTATRGNSSGKSSVIEVVPDKETVDSSGTKVVERVRDAINGAIDGDVGIAGDGAAVEDYKTAVYDKFPYVLALIALITYVLLVRTFRSLLLPLKAVVLNLVSLSAVFGAVVFFWQDGHGSNLVFGVAATGAVTFWLPVLIFAFLFGLSMDYEVFILARMREEYDATGSTSSAVITGLGRTGRLVTSAALILFFAFAALASGPETDIKVLGTALGVGILIDATVVRALLVPALVSLFGSYNWWLPTGVARVLRVEPSPLAPAEPSSGSGGSGGAAPVPA